MAEGHRKSAVGRSSRKGSGAYSRGTAGGRRRKKASVYIPANRLIALCAVVIAVCSLLLVVSTALDVREVQVSDGGFSAPPAPAPAGHTAAAARPPSAGSERQPPAQGGAASGSGPSSVVRPPERKREEAPSMARGTADASNAVPARRQEGSALPPARSAAASEASSGGAAAAQPDASGLPAIPAAHDGATLVFVFDDGGQNMNQLERFVSLPFPITVAVLPQLAHSAAAAERVRASGNEVMLHQPMQAVNRNVDPGPGAITPELSMDEIRTVLRRNIAEVGPVSGINNHEGSLISEDEARIGTVLQTASDMGLYFLDSRTTSQTRVPQAAMALGLSYYERNIFLDNTKERADIVAEIMKGLAVANRKGCAIMIGHVWSADVLPGILLELHPLLVRAGYRFATVSQSGALVLP